MTGFDYAVLGVLLVSVALGVARGLVRELFALASWILAVIAARIFAPDVLPLLPAALADPGLRALAAYVAVFAAVWAFLAVCGAMLGALIKSIGLTPADRLLGAAFGIVRGAAIIMTGVLLAGLTTLPRYPVWRHAVFSAPLVALAEALKIWLPNDVAAHIYYGSGPRDSTA